MENDWTNIYKKYKGLWVALLEDQITAAGRGKTLQDARREAEKNGHKETYAMFVPEEMFDFVGAS
ncbi:MAG TPA: hypothetical protein VJG64_03875 [Candidatus Paceibacterota bacterium]